jgi:signal transduction histidine kinase
MFALALLFGILTLFGVLFSFAILHAAPTRWDNRVFAVAGLLDAVQNGYRAVRFLGGHPVVDPDAQIVCGLIGFPLAALTVEFAWSFPFDRPAPAKLRLPVWAWTSFAFGVTVIPSFRVAHPEWQALFHSMPLFLLAAALFWRNLRAATGDRGAIRLVAIAFTLRWGSDIFGYGVVKPLAPGLFPSFILFDATAVTIIAYFIIALAFMRSQLLRIRGVASELLVSSAVALMIVALSALAIEAALHAATGPGALRVGLVLASFVPVIGVVLGARFGRGFRDGALRSVDPRRHLREQVLARVDAARDPDPRSFLFVVEAALGELAEGHATYLARSAETAVPGTPLLPAELARRLGERPGEPLLRTHDPALAYDLVVAVPSSTTSIHGALALRGLQIDRDAVLGTAAIAERVGLKLDAYALFRELEASRRLATLGAFAAAIAHDIRTPLTSVQMNVQILRRKVDLPPDDMEYFDIALEELRRLNANITELLDFAKPAQVESAPVDLAAVIADARRATQSVLEDKALRLVVEGTDRKPFVLGDAVRLHNVLENLITNAAAASAEGAAIRVRTRRADDGRTAIEVEDEGRGIAPTDLGRIFEPFFTTRPDGTGLGLAICDKLVRAQNGEIRVESAPGVGSTFTVLLPSIPEPGEPLHESLLQR